VPRSAEELDPTEEQAATEPTRRRPAVRVATREFDMGECLPRGRSIRPTYVVYEDL
jgi:hypothetical protein